jgi:pyruvate formate lyase activating enzyme
MPFSDLVLFDLKQIDPVKHARLTDAGNETIVANLLRIGRSIRSGSTPTELWIRTPVIPGATDSEKNISGIGALIAGNLNGCVQRWDLLAFNNLCKDKYLRLDRKWAFETADLIGRDRMEKLAETARRSGVDPEIVHWSGITKIEN